MQSGGTLGLPGASSRLSLSRLTLGSALADSVALNCTVADPGLESFNVTGSDGLAVNATVIVNVDSVSPLLPGTYNLIRYSGALQGAGSLLLGNLSSQGPAYLVNNTSASALQLVVTGPDNTVAWVGTPSNNWDLLGSNVWRTLNTGTPASYQDGMSALFADNASNFVVNIPAAVTPVSAVVSNSTRHYQFTGSGQIAGIARLIKQGTGTLSLDNTNTYASPTLVQGGTLWVTGSIGLSTVTVQTNATLGGTGSIGGATIIQAGGSLAIGSASPGTLAIRNTLTLAADSTTVLRLHRTAEALTNDQIRELTGVTYGNSIVTASGDPLVLGDKFTLFSKTSGVYLGAFATLTLPPLPPGLKWDASGLAVDGSILVVSGALGNILLLEDDDPGSSRGGRLPRPAIYNTPKCRQRVLVIGSANDNATALLTASGQAHHEGHAGFFIQATAIGGVPTPNGMGGLYENLDAWIGQPRAAQDHSPHDRRQRHRLRLCQPRDNAPARLAALINRIYALAAGRHALCGLGNPSHRGLR